MSDLARLVEENKNRLDLNAPVAEVEVGIPEVISDAEEEGTVSPLRSIVSRLRDDQQAAVRASMNQALDQNPDQFVEDRKIAEQQQVPLETVQRNRDQYKKRQTLDSLDLNKMLTQTPALGEMLKDPEFAIAAQDNTDELSALEMAAQPFRSFAAGFPRFSGASYEVFAVPFDLLSEVSRALDEATGGTGTGYDPAGEVATFLRGIAKGQRNLASHVRGDVSEYSPTAQAAFSGFESAGQQLPGMFAFLLTGNPAFLYGGAGFVAGGESVGAAKDQGLSPSQATIYGTADAGIEIATEMLPALKLLGDLKVGSSLFKTLYSQLQTEIPQEQIATLFQDLNAWAVLPENRDKTIMDYVEARPGAAWHTLVATITGTGTQTTIAHTANKTLDLLVERSETKLKERSREQFRKFAKKMFEGSDVEEVHIDADRFVQYFQEAGLDPFDPANKEIFESLDVVDQLDDTKEAKGTIAIPLESYITDIAGTEHHTGLAPDIRFQPDGWSLREAEEIAVKNPDFTEEVQHEAETLLNQIEDQGSSDALFEKIKQYLVNTGMDINTAARNVELYRAFSNTVFARHGMTPEELLERYGLQIRRVLPEAFQEKTSAELDVLVEQIAQPSPTPATRKIYGPSLLEFLADRGGVLDDGGEMSHRDAQQWHVGKPGQKRLVNEEGEGLDGAAQAAWEAGYIPGVSYEELTQDNLLEAIDRELGGDVVYSPANMDTQAIDQLENRNQLIDFLESIGIDTAQTDKDALREAVRTALYDEQGQVLTQQTLLEAAQRRWEKSVTTMLEKKDRGFKARMTTPAVLKTFGFEKSFLELPYGVLNAALSKHKDVPYAVIKNLPALISNPLYVYPHENGLRIVLDTTTEAGEPIVVGVRTGKDSRITTITPIHNNPGRRGVTRVRHQFKEAAFGGEKVYARDAKTLAEAKVLARQDSGKGTIPKGSSRLSNNILTRIDLVKQHGQEFFQVEEEYLTDGSGVATFTQGRIDYIFREQGYIDGRVIAAIATINPAEFIGATTVAADVASIRDEVTPLDEHKLRDESQTPYLRIEQVHSDDTFDVDYRIIGHEGRHRMQALADAGITQVPVVILQNRATETLGLPPQVELQGQTYYTNERKEDEQSLNTITISNPIDVTYKNKERIVSEYSVPQAQVYFQSANQQLGLYSAVEQAVIDMPLPAWKGSKKNPEGIANGTDIWAKVRGMPNVKKEELKWLGLEEYLKAGRYTREEVLNFVRNNGVKLEETVADMDESELATELTWDEEIDTDSANWEHRVEDLMYEFDNDAPESLYWFNYEDQRDQIMDRIMGDDETYIREGMGEQAEGVEDLTSSMKAVRWVEENFADEIAAELFELAEEAANKAAEEEYLDSPYIRYTAAEADIEIYGNDEIGYTVDGQHVGYSFAEAEARAEETAHDEGVFRDESDEQVAKWGGHFGSGSTYREIKLKLPEVSGDFTHTLHFPDRNILAFMLVEDANLQDDTIDMTAEALKALPPAVEWMEQYGESIKAYLETQIKRNISFANPDATSVSEVRLKVLETYNNLTAEIAALEAYLNPDQQHLPFLEDDRLQRNLESLTRRELEGQLQNKQYEQFTAAGQVMGVIHTEWVDVAAQREPDPGGALALTSVGELRNKTLSILKKMRAAEKSDEMNSYYIHEMQSDWHQKGRKQGYKTGVNVFTLQSQKETYERAVHKKSRILKDKSEAGTTTEAQESAMQALVANDPHAGDVQHAIERAVQGQVARDYQDGQELRNAQFRIIKSVPELQEIAEDASKKYELQKQLDIEYEGVPDAPFKKDVWIALAVKRAIVDAVEQGYDAFSWADAETVASHESSALVKSYAKQYDEKMPSLVKKLTGIKPTHDVTGTEGLWFIRITPELAERVKSSGFTLFQHTPQFKEWFGDSKVVDENGDPLVVYRGEHGQFEESALQTELGSYSFGSRQAANEYAMTPNRGDQSAASPRVVPAYLSIQNPVVNTPDDPFIDVSVLTDLLGEEKAAEITRKFADAIMDTNNWMDDFEEQYGSVEALLEQNPEKINELYFDAWQLFDDPEVVELFREAGYDGAIHGGTGVTALEPEYKVFSPDQVRSAISGSMQQDGKKGSIQFREGETLVSLFEQADLSTFLHESGHFFLEVLGDLAEQTDDANLNQDYATILNFLGVESRQAIGIEQHEKFARAFEAYLFEGRAPSVELQSAFQRFKAWLINVYKHIKNLNVEINDDIRKVFDRMLATDEEIAQAEKMNQYVPLFESAEQAGMTEREFKAYMASAERASRQAEDELEKRKLAEVRRERTRLWRDQRKKMREEIENEVNQMRVYQVIHFLQRGETLVGRLPEGLQPMKLDRQGLLDLYGGAEVLRLLPGRGRFLTYTREGGVHPDALAEFFGYDTGRDMVDEIIEAEKKQKYIDLLTEQRMREEHGDIYMDGRVEEEALDAVHNDRRGTFLATEVKALSKRVGLPGTPANMARAAAEQIIGRQKVSKLRPGQYHAAEVRAAKAAERAILQENWSEAAVQKRAQLLNHYLFREARRAQEDVDTILKRLSRYNKPGTRKNLAREYLDQIDKILEKFDLKRSVSLKEIARRKAFKTFVDERQADGQEVIVTDHLQTLLEQAERVHYKDLPLDELRGLDDTIKNIAHLARLKQKLIAGMEKRDYEQVVHHMVVTAEAEHTWHEEPVDYSEGKWKQVKKWTKAFLAEHRKLEFVFRQMDGEAANGPFWTNLFKPLANAENAELEMQQQAVDRLNEIFGRFTRRQRNSWHKKIKTDNGMGVQTKMSIISMALNWGNADNRIALLKGRGWSATQVEMLFDKHLTKEDWDFVQDIWDHVNSYWPQIAALENELTGVTPKKVPPTEVETKHGTYRGGYYPLKYDPEHSHRAFKRAEKEATEDLFESNWLKPATKQGHTKERVGSGGQAVRLDLGVIAEHLNNVIHDISHRKAIIQVDRLSQDRRIREAITKVAGKEVYRQIRPWLQSIASDQRLLTSVAENIIGHVRQGATVVNMGWKVTTAIVQPLGYLQSLDVLGEKWAMKGLMKFYNPARFRKNIDFIMENSVAMRHRQQTFDRDVRDTLKRVTRDTAMAHLKKTFFMHIGFLDMSVSMPTWLGAYEKGTAEGMVHDDAVAYADSVVRQTQSAGGAKDLADIQRGGETWRMFTMFYSYFSVLYNLMARRTQMTKESRSGAWRAFTSFIYLAVLPSVLAELIVGRGPDEDDDEEWGPWMAKTVATYPLQTMVGVRDITSGVASDYGYGFTPVAQAIEQGVTAVKSADDFLDEDEEFSKWDAKNWAMWGGYLTKLPVRQLWNSGEEVYETLAEGDDFSIWEFLIRQDPDK